LSPGQKKGLTRLSILLTLVVALVIGLICGGVFDNNDHAYSKSSNKSIGAGVAATGKIPGSLKATVVPKQSAPYKLVQFLSPVIDITPSGQLPKPITLSLPLSNPVTTGTKVYVAVNATHKSADWQVRLGKLSADGQSVRITTDHLSWWQTFIVDPNGTYDEFQKNVVFALTGVDQILVDAKRPSCKNSSAASNSEYTVSATTKEAIYYCFGSDSNAHTVKVTNRKNYPINVRYSGMAVADRGHTDGVFTRLRKFAGSNTVILFPSDTATFNVDLKRGGQAWLKTDFSGWAEHLYRLDIALEGLVTVATEGKVIGADVVKGEKIFKLMDSLLSVEACQSAVKNDDLLHTLVHCLQPDKLVEFFGLGGAAMMLGTVSSAATVAGWLKGELNSTLDNIRGNDKAYVAISRQLPGHQVTFHGLALTIPSSWAKGTVFRSYGDMLGIRSGQLCQGTSIGSTVCPGIEIHGPAGIGQGFPGVPYNGTTEWERSNGVSECASDLSQTTLIPAVLKHKETVTVGGKQASYMEWTIPCSSGASYVQRLWWLPREKILIDDEWNTPGLAAILKNATWK
jgi:hypothetical protein